MGMYKELLNEIELHKNYLEVAELNYEYYNKIFTSNVHMDLYNNIMKMQKWLIERETEESILRELNYRKDEIDKCINNTNDIMVKVSQLRDMGLTQEQVGELVDRSPRQIQNIEAKLKILTNIS